MSGVNSQGYIGVTDRYTVQSTRQAGQGDMINPTPSRASWTYDSATGVVTGTGVIYFNALFAVGAETNPLELVAKVPYPDGVPQLVFPGYSQQAAPIALRVVKSGDDSINISVENLHTTAIDILDPVPFSVSWLATVNRLA